jgi:hypothetical protein
MREHADFGMFGSRHSTELEEDKGGGKVTSLAKGDLNLPDFAECRFLSDYHSLPRFATLPSRVISAVACFGAFRRICCASDNLTCGHFNRVGAFITSS